MKKCVLISAIVLISLNIFAQAELDQNRGTIKTCRGHVDEVGTVAFKASIHKQSGENGSLLLQIDTQILECKASGWAVVENPIVPSGKGQLSYSRFELLVSSDRGLLFSATPLRATDSQQITISAEQMASLGDSFIEIGSRALEVFSYQGQVIDQQLTFFGSYLVR